MVYNGILMETIGISVVSIGLLLLLFLAGESPPPKKCTNLSICIQIL